MAVAGVGPNFLKAVAALSAASPLVWLGGASGFHLLTHIGISVTGLEPDEADLLFLASGLIPAGVVVALALCLGTGASMRLRIGFGLCAGLWALLWIGTNFFGSVATMNSPVFFYGPAVVIGTFLAWLGRPRRVSAGRVAASVLLLWLAAWLLLFIQSLHILPLGLEGFLLMGLPLTLFFLPLARMQVAPVVSAPKYPARGA